MNTHDLLGLIKVVASSASMFLSIACMILVLDKRERRPALARHYVPVAGIDWNTITDVPVTLRGYRIAQPHPSTP